MCPTCGRRFAPTRDDAFAEGTRYCSVACRFRRPGPRDELLEDAIVQLLEFRAPGASICPSEAARLVGGSDWRRLMADTLTAARRLVDEGVLEITRSGHPVDPAAAGGPVRLRFAAQLPDA